eukprot:GFYU01023137.1.p1 GENE.GFYU01023137.1~~GFYU01023137.1.p1  ORF type:complete len:287 (-),score=22.55 GFYU01023137.1:219-1079(-)
MGLCKTCKKGTGLYCFVHRCHLCDNCITRPEHTLCVVKSYLSWVQDSEYQWPPKCSLCEQNVTEESGCRLTCLDLFHKDCLDRHFQALPPYTTPAGVVCPKCSIQVTPTKQAQSLLAQNVRKYLQGKDWAKALNLPVWDAPEPTPQLNGGAPGFGAPGPNGDKVGPLKGGSSLLDSTAYHAQATTAVAPRFSVSGLASRNKQTAGQAGVQPSEDSEEDKYRDLPVKPGKTGLDEFGAYGENTGQNVDTKRALMLIGLLSGVLTLLVIFFYVGEEETGTVRGVPRKL